VGARVAEGAIAGAANGRLGMGNAKGKNLNLA
jgi:hypothetical protein